MGFTISLLSKIIGDFNITKITSNVKTAKKLRAIYLSQSVDF